MFYNEVVVIILFSFIFIYLFLLTIEVFREQYALQNNEKFRGLYLDSLKKNAQLVCQT